MASDRRAWSGPVYRDRAVCFGDVLVVADLHLGKAAASNVEAPLGTSADVRDRLEGLVDRFDPATVVLAGDLLHAFDHVPDVAGRTLRELAASIRDAGCRPVALAGNHDAMLASVWPGRVREEYRFVTPDDRVTVACHGHEAPETDADRYVIGHDHPAIVIEGRKRQCYLAGSGVYRGADLLVLPAFNRLVAGVAVNHRIGEAGKRSPLVTDIGSLRPIVYDPDAAETLEFPRLDRFQSML